MKSRSRVRAVLREYREQVNRLARANPPGGDADLDPELLPVWACEEILRAIEEQFPDRTRVPVGELVLPAELKRQVAEACEKGRWPGRPDAPP